MSKEIKMLNGMVLSRGEENFKADESLVLKSLSYVSKISQGLYSGTLNSDNEFSKFQNETMKKLIEEEKNRLCKDVVLGAEKQLKRIAEKTLIEKEKSYFYNGRKSYSTPVQDIDLVPIDISTVEIKEKNKVVGTAEIIEERGNKLAGFGEKELKKIKEAIKEAKEVRKIAKERMAKRTKKKAVSKKKTKKTTKKKVDNKK